MPSDIPSDIPSDQPSSLPSSMPSDIPSDIPSDQPSSLPSRDPSSEPSLLPSSEPSSQPSDCVDEEGWVVGGIPGVDEYAGLSCEELNTTNADSWCDAVMNEPNSTYLGKTVDEACCACHGSTFKTTYPSSVPTSRPSISSLPTVEPIPSSQPSDCVDEPGWFFYTNNDNGKQLQLGCLDLSVTIERDDCERFENIDSNGKTVRNACCICGGGMHQSREPSLVPTISQMPSVVPSLSAMPTDRPSLIPSSSPTVSIMPSDTPSGENATVIDLKPCRYSRECLSSYPSVESTTADPNACLKDEGENVGICKPGVSFSPFQYIYRRKF